MFMQHEIAGAERAYAFTVGHGGAILARTLREAVEMEAQRLIDWLDDLDPDPDLEPYLTSGPMGPNDDREADYEHLSGVGISDHEPDEADEPSLATPECNPTVVREVFTNRIVNVLGGDQSRQSFGRSDECEDEHDGSEPDESGYGDLDGLIADESGEVELGATEDINHELAWNTLSALDTSVEDGEPSLGWSGYGTGLALDREAPRDDREDDVGDDAEMDDDREPCPDVMGEWSLGSVECIHQGAWSHGEGRDLRAGR